MNNLINYDSETTWFSFKNSFKFGLDVRNYFLSCINYCLTF